MSAEEQLAWFSDSGNQLSDALAANTRELMGLKAMIQRLGEGQKEVIRTLNLAAETGLPTPDLVSTSVFTRRDNFDLVTRSLAPSLVLLFHRLICFDLPERGVGRLRSSEVWLGNADGVRADHAQPPPASEVPSLLEAICENWRDNFKRLEGSSAKIRRLAIAKFHAAFLVTHPFLDGNGRVARAILMQQCLDLFGRADMSLMEKGARYYAALSQADKGDASALASLLEPVVAT
ncbi:hypothetical protein DDF67_09770 [Caulobacter endophyticus]|uniref:Fido domain-containing protein n=2 Tax=Caulobacter endophyticus TaxID=2172652 RepID=A0A2T9K495_9CAUL|nr:hypothetical protein DDF67_09770 [Caulobacter endophyticus]